MASSIFLDANVLLDFTLKRTNYYPNKSLMELIISGKLNAFVSPSIIQILGYWLTKAYTIEMSKEILLTLLNDVKVIDINHEQVVMALHSKIDDAEDAIQYYTALHHKVDFFISEDKKLKRLAMPHLPVYSVESLLKMLR